MSTYNIENEANSVFAALMQGIDFDIPDIDLSGPEYEIPGGSDSAMYQQPTKLTGDDLVGTFNTMMGAMKALLQKEFEMSRITGAEYTKAYVALVSSSLGNSTLFLLGRDQAYWQAVTAQIAAVTAKVTLQTSKVQLAAIQLEAQTSAANFALTKAKLATESVNYGIAGYNLATILPAQYAKVQVETTLTTHQMKLVDEQAEPARAQPLDSRSDGQAVSGSVGKQKSLYDQQITSYKRQAEVNAAKLFTDAWITQKTIDEGLTAPSNFANDSVNNILGTLKANNSLG